MKINETPLELPPLSLYVHIPWCVRKCPYCDFNSHDVRGELPIANYISALRSDLTDDRWMAQNRQLHSIFFGGGTPSLLPNAAIKEILEFIDEIIGIDVRAEITIEANPGTIEFHDFAELRDTGVNRLSLGVQSFNPEHLKSLGRIHSADEAEKAISRALRGGFDNLNVDLMHGLPRQSLDEACHDLETAISLGPTHISWYQLTIEPNTEFFTQPPMLPHEDLLMDIIERGQQILSSAGFHQYEVSAYARDAQKSRHNLNYWCFGDYLGIGAGAHGKITVPEEARIFRYQKTRLPQDYLDHKKNFTTRTQTIANEDLVVEFLMNALRLNQNTHFSLFETRTGMNRRALEFKVEQLVSKGLMQTTDRELALTALGRKFLNTILEEFL